MIGTTLVELVFIRTAITSLRLVAPLSLVYLAAESWRGKLVVASPLTWYTVLELSFFSLVYLPRKRHIQKVGALNYCLHQSQTTLVTLDQP